MKIMYLASEVAPFIKTGGLGDVAGSLPKALQQAGHEVAVFCPMYEQINSEWKQNFTRIANFYVDLGWRRQFCGVYTYEKDGVTYYFLDNKYYFSRPRIYGEFDDGERFAFFCKAALDCLPELGYTPDVIHCNDWQTALVPVYHALQYCKHPYYSQMKTVFTIHNIEYQGWYSPETLEDVFGIDQMHLYSGLLVMNGMINLMKSAIVLAHAVTTVSPTYAEEIRTYGYGEGLDEVLRMYEGKLHGVLNGIDCDSFNPATDVHLTAPYTTDTIADKAKNRQALLTLSGLQADDRTPVVCIVSRLAAHKGLELIEHVLDEILQEDLRLIVLGTGEQHFETMFFEAQAAYPDKVKLFNQFSTSLASQIYAGADLLLMPSRSEPCGLSQMIAMRYGTLPLVRETGGLQDTVQPYVDFLGVGDGFTFHSYNAHDMLHVIREACTVYATKPDAWRKMQLHDMARDFTWSASAKQYLEIYSNL